MHGREISRRADCRNWALWLLGFIIFASFAHGAIADDKKPIVRATKEEAVAFVEKAVAYFNANGPDKAFAAFSDPKGPFIDRDLYIYAIDSTGTSLANGENIKIVGKNLIDQQDADGKYINRERIELMKANKSFWQHYKWSDPVTHKLLPKQAYCEVVNDAVLRDIVICSGIYDAQP